ncbi:hypothetical protein BASA50_009824 [Batrachochytrium salamandrivorans]|uniref:Xaa-Pro dipeptidyl-peptidase-like domain-containing protein n=1 Tax=Batrachochytrium salamandrivorans TaxID=1357716 RepID=A0ABQ8F050_9FUNG|nr:hypothetical protein BASA60_011253 [Batrachochytrium salamandrivorans]KAH6568521.1 hypothetical protein BASA62_005411 [Batrachochytrium salamandrivorans]KAH6589731.1 hypothetical protein BASA50_009824 [Batrachochytrium salamandrivorans]KAH9247901.1 hypothetical protein BASA81_014498 [Batrachochytrium salamandrivorans]
MPRAIPNNLHLRELHIDIPSTGDAVLKGRLFVGDKHKSICVVLAHPYGPLGGDMNNNIVEVLFSYFASLGYTTLRFNFRGVNGSTGRSTFRGFGEVDDVVAVSQFVLSGQHCKPPPTQIIMCGYSYGSIATGAAACKVPQTIATISISYPVGVLWALTLGHQRKHISGLQSLPATVLKYFIIGGKDNFTSEAAFMQFTTDMPNPKTVVVVPDIDHFWSGTEASLIGYVSQWVTRCLRPHQSGYVSTNDLSVSVPRQSIDLQANSEIAQPLSSDKSSGRNKLLTPPPLPLTPSPKGCIPSQIFQVSSNIPIDKKSESTIPMSE